MRMLVAGELRLVGIVSLFRQAKKNLHKDLSVVTRMYLGSKNIHIYFENNITILSGNTHVLSLVKLQRTLIASNGLPSLGSIQK